MAWIDYKKEYDIVPQSWIIDCLKMYKITGEVVKFTEHTMENWRVELKIGGKNLTEVKIQRGIFQGDALTPLLFVIAMMPLNHIHRQCSGKYKLHKLQEKINYLIHMKDIKLFAKKEGTGNPNTGSDNKQSGYRDGIWHRKMHHANNEKRKTTHDGRNRTTKSRKNQNARRKGNLQIFGNVGSGNH